MPVLASDSVEDVGDLARGSGIPNRLAMQEWRYENARRFAKGVNRMVCSARSNWFGAWVAAIVVVKATASGCSADVDGSAELRRAIVEAAAIPAAEAAGMGQRGVTGAEGLAVIQDQRLTIALLALVTRGPFCREDGAYLSEQGSSPGLEYKELMTDPGVLAGCFRAPTADRRLAASIADEFSRRSGDRGGDWSQVISAIWPSYITDIESDTDGESLDGVVTYTAPGCWQGRIGFHAALSDERWVVTGFDLPLLGWAVTLEESGTWKATRTKPGVSFPKAHRIGVDTDGRSVFSGVTFPNDRVVMVGFGAGGTLEVFDGDGNPHKSEGPSEFIDGRPVVLVPSTRDATVGDFLDALTAVHSSEPSVPAIGMFGMQPGAEFSGRGEILENITLITDGSMIPIDEPINAGPRFCISPSAIHVSTGQEMPLPVEHKGETLVFAEYEVRKHPDRVFLINPQREASFSDFEVVLVAIQRAGGGGAVVAVERYRGIAVVFGG